MHTWEIIRDTKTPHDEKNIFIYAYIKWIIQKYFFILYSYA